MNLVCLSSFNPMKDLVEGFGEELIDLILLNLLQYAFYPCALYEKIQSCVLGFIATSCIELIYMMYLISDT